MNTENKLNELVEQAKNMILNGVLLKNVQRHFENTGTPNKLTEKLMKMADLKADLYMFNKAK